MYPTQTTEVKFMPTRYQQGKSLARAGYALAENIYVPGLYEVHRPTGGHYLVDTTGEEPTCNCQARVRDCKHVIFVTHCLNFIQSRKPSAYEQEVAASLYAPSRLETVRPAQQQTFSLVERAELSAAAAKGRNINLDF
jgi:hypothetical protein